MFSSLAPFRHLQQTYFKLHKIYSEISEQINPLQLVGKVGELKVQSKFQPPACHLAINPKGSSR